MAFAVALGWSRLGLGSGQQGAAQCELGGTMTVGEEAEMADAVKGTRHDLEHEKCAELVCGPGVHLVFAVASVVLPGEADLAVGEPDQPAVGNGDAVCVAAEIGE